MKKSLLLVGLLALSTTCIHAGVLQRGKVQMFCHRTANTDMPENTLESLALAARMGCSVVEIDVRRTLDNQLILNHDGILDRLTGGIGTVEEVSSDELALLDAGAWMGQRFANMRIPTFDEALELARQQGIILELDMKTVGEGPLVLAALKRHDMLQRVLFGGHWDDIPPLYPAANADPVKYLSPACTSAEITALHQQGYFVVVNFSANPHDMDLSSMRAAVAAGADAINVDYPRLGADAIGRPVESKLAALATTATTGSIPTRTAAIRELSHYPGFPTQQLFTRWLRDPDAQISHAAAVALVIARPQTPISIFTEALASPQKTARQNAAWALGILGAPAIAALLPLLNERDSNLVTEALLALSRCPGDVPAIRLTPFLASDQPMIRATAALALARHHPQTATPVVSAALDRAERDSIQIHAQVAHREISTYTPQEIDALSTNFREQMKIIQATEQLPPPDALHLLEARALVPIDPGSSFNALVAGYQLWDRIAADPTAAIHALSSSDPETANRAEWILIKADPSILLAVRAALPSSIPATRDRLIRILAWQGDTASLHLLREQRQSHPENNALINWAISKIETLTFKP